jgi:acetolactate synthase-1/2/3 large subunit
VDFEHSVDFVKLAEAYGAVGYRITTKDQVEDVILKALNNDKPTVIDCIIERNEKVYPMVPAGAPINKMMGIDKNQNN